MSTLNHGAEQSAPQGDDLSGGVEVTLAEPQPCEAVNCLEQFVAEWPNQRRCKRCRAEGREYKTVGAPF